ncbi:MAG: LysR family transcriptional regulator [Candidatus Syntrophonatronum acetioxidans]|uniref:LysR family transcriptional regulator n=1 Tax=Candidatus Syntrophonatronum acetioxidans TaxID=1795816 RepID=A0A424YCN4_9FIRM|nr:MAG: LysR family transcriptional regulator [Candidatus Syntrophonatronum acetioxidans]
MNKKDFWSYFKVILEIEGEKRISGNNLFNLLEKIMLSGSISSAASSLGFSYRYAWGLIKEAEKAMGLQLVEKQAGGVAGGGTSLTREGRDLLFQYKSFREEIERQLQSLKVPSGEEKREMPAEAKSLPQPGGHLLLASTMEPIEAGLLDLLEESFYRARNILVRHIALGSGRALEIAREGRVDLVLTHAPELEEEFMREGWGSLRIPLMANDFVVAGPSSDPAGISSFTSGGIRETLGHIARKKALFISRGDQSGTHLREQEIWEASGVKPGGGWYLVSPGVAGNLGILYLASEKGAYTLVDRASYLLAQRKDMALYTLEVEEEEKKLLHNIFVLMVINPERFSSVNYQEALQFVSWLQEEGKIIIGNFGKEKYGEPLFSLIDGEK